MADWQYPSPPSSNASTSSVASSGRLLRAPRLVPVSLPTRDTADAFHNARTVAREHRPVPTPVLSAPLDELWDIQPVTPFAPPTIPIALPPIPDDVPYVPPHMPSSSTGSSGTRSSMSSASSWSSRRSSGPASPVLLHETHGVHHMHSRTMFSSAGSTGSSGTRSSMSSASSRSSRWSSGLESPILPHETHDAHHMHSRMVVSSSAGSTGSSGTRSSMSSASSRSSRRSGGLASPTLLHEGLSMGLLYDLMSEPDTAQASFISRSLHLSSGSGEAGPSSAASNHQSRPSPFPLDDVATYPVAVRIRVEVGPHTIVVDASDGKAVTCRDVLSAVHDFLWFHPPHPSLEVTQSTQLTYRRRIAHGKDTLRNIDFLDGRTTCLRFSVRRSRDPGTTLVLDTTQPSS